VLSSVGIEGINMEEAKEKAEKLSSLWEEDIRFISDSSSSPKRRLRSRYRQGFPLSSPPSPPFSPLTLPLPSLPAFSPRGSSVGLLIILPSYLSIP
jgi:hypothetical protein